MELPKKQKVLNILISYAYCTDSTPKFLLDIKNRCKERDIEFNLLIDSGAFTAWSVGKEVNLDSYLKFIDSLEAVRPFNYIQLDVVGNEEKTMENLREMHKRGYTDTMPVFTRGSSIDLLHELYTYSDYIALGGVMGAGLQYAKYFMNLPVNKGKKQHLLGLTSDILVKSLKPYSVDSSTFTVGNRFGCFVFFHKSKLILKHKEKVKTSKDFMEIQDMVIKNGYTKDYFTKMFSDNHTKGSFFLHFNLKSVIRYMNYVFPDTRYYIAVQNGYLNFVSDNLDSLI